MPGARLTQRDRSSIASGLADGLGYAEIARDLGRPTSTITREVARNGGPGGYRADHAHRATEWRARRRAPAAATRPAPVAVDGRDPEVVHGFVEQFAATMVGAGLPRMAARVLSCLVTTDAGALTAADLVRRLGVSPASVSKAVGYLEGLEVLRRERAQGRRERYVIDDDVWIDTWMTSARTNATWAETSAHGADLLGAHTPAGARLADMGRFFARLSDDMAGGPDRDTLDDALTVVAALAQAGTALSEARLAAALGWHADRVGTAVRCVEHHPEIAGPLALRRHEDDALTVTVDPERLTGEQRSALAASG